MATITSGILYGTAADEALSAGVVRDPATNTDVVVFTVFGGGGNDTLTAANVPFVFKGVTYDEHSQLVGEDGNDVLVGGIRGDGLNGGLGNDSLFGGAGDDMLRDDDGNDVLNGGDGNDTITAAGGGDTIDGGAGADLLVMSGDATTTVVSNVERLGLGNGAQIRLTAAQVNSYSSVEYLGSPTGAGFHLTLATAGSIGANFSTLNYGSIMGSSGADTINVSQTVVGAFDHSWLISAGDDLGGNVLTGGEGRDTLNAGAGGDTLNGHLGADNLNGGAGNDTLNGGEGDDRLGGGAGNDTYYVDSAGDQVIEVTGGGSDTVFATTNFALGTGQEVEFLRVAGAAGRVLTGNELANYLTGGVGGDTLGGGAGNDKLDGKAGADVLAGGAGDDTYFVDNAGDQVIEVTGGGSDTVFATANFALGTGQEVEFLRVAGAAGLTLTGNELANALVGGVGGDTLGGGAGNDKLDGKVGADVLAGGAGHDTYYVDNAGDQVIEVTGGGSDTVFATTNFTLGTGQEVEFLRVAGAAGLTLTGNELANALVGDVGGDTLGGGAGNDKLDGKAGADVLAGGAGDDTYYVDNAGDQVIEVTGGGSDTVFAATNFALGTGQEVEFLRVAGAAGRVLTGNELANYLTGDVGGDTLGGGAGNDKLDGKAGADVLAGGAGDDTYFVDNAGDQVIEVTGGGSDTVFATANFALGTGQEVEFLRVAGAAGLTLTGNELANALVGGAGSDKLDGGAGADTMTGGAGADTLDGGSGRDRLAGGSGDDVFVFSSLTDSGTTGTTRDVILDFVRGEDTIDLSAIDAVTGGGGDAFTFIGTSGFSGTAGELRAVALGANTLLSADVNGDAAVDFTVLMMGSHVLIDSDFVL